ncbi:hypothetical protein IAU59_004767 [Kwoniella sp. CBS 9459]
MNIKEKKEEEERGPPATTQAGYAMRGNDSLRIAAQRLKHYAAADTRSEVTTAGTRTSVGSAAPSEFALQSSFSQRTSPSTAPHFPFVVCDNPPASLSDQVFQYHTASQRSIYPTDLAQSDATATSKNEGQTAQTKTVTE